MIVAESHFQYFECKHISWDLTILCEVAHDLSYQDFNKNNNKTTQDNICLKLWHEIQKAGPLIHSPLNKGGTVLVVICAAEKNQTVRFSLYNLTCGDTRSFLFFPFWRNEEFTHHHIVLVPPASIMAKLLASSHISKQKQSIRLQPRAGLQLCVHKCVFKQCAVVWPSWFPGLNTLHACWCVFMRIAMVCLSESLCTGQSWPQRWKMCEPETTQAEERKKYFLKAYSTF